MKLFVLLDCIPQFFKQVSVVRPFNSDLDDQYLIISYTPSVSQTIGLLISPPRGYSSNLCVLTAYHLFCFWDRNSVTKFQS